jgi:SAM-dependent methyltransferase
LSFGFPLYRHSGAPWESLSASQEGALNRFRDKLQTGEYRLVENPCLCGSTRPELDRPLSEVDRYGLPVATLICSQCGILRSATVLDEPSTLSFYEFDYRGIYGQAAHPTEAFLNDQRFRGKRMADIFFAVAGDTGATDLRVFEIGCGAGGILLAFRERGCRCAGCDFNNEYLAFGRQHGLDLRKGAFTDLIADNSQDLIVMSHVLEHFHNPIDALSRAVAKLAPGGRIIIEVPGIFSIHKVYFAPIAYLQNAHIYSFFAASMRELLLAAGLDPLYIDETVVAVAAKPAQPRAPRPRGISSASLKSFPSKVRTYLLATYWLHELRINPYYLMTAISRIIGRH